ncbi:MAG: transcriptional repressor [Clostridia bacterium]|nr:transcriptional repressor [Clostridia bacterium]
MQYNTKQRDILINFLEENRDKTYSVEDITNALVNMDISPSAVYRNLATLENEGRVRKVFKTGARKAFYQYVDSSKCKGRLHLYCTKCGSTTHLDSMDSLYIIQNLKQNASFDLDQDNTIIYGLCRKCKKK